MMQKRLSKRGVQRALARQTITWRTKAILACAAGLLAVSACDAPSVVRPTGTYSATSLTGGVSYRWASGKTVRVWVVTEPLAPFDLGFAVRRAIEEWNDVAQFAEFRLTTANSLAEADLIVYDRAMPSPVSRLGDCPFDPRSAAGYTYFCPSATTPERAEPFLSVDGAPLPATVLIMVDRARIASESSYRAIVAHELGHALGIGGHSDVASDLMFGLPTVDTPSSRDVSTLRALLGVRPQLTL